MYQYGFTTVTFRKLNVSQIFDIAKESDVDVIEWGGDIHVPSTDLQNAEKVSAVSGELNIPTCSYGSYFRVKADNNDIKQFDDVCMCAKSLGTSVVRLWLNNKASNVTESMERDNLVGEVQKLADIAEGYGLTIAFEFHQGTYNDSGKTCAEFIALCKRKNVKTLWQPMGDIDIDLANLKQVLPHIIEVHVFHWSKRGRRYLLERGRAKWEQFVDMIKDNNKDCTYILEFVKKDKVKNFKKDIRELKNMLKRCYGK